EIDVLLVGAEQLLRPQVRDAGRIALELRPYGRLDADEQLRARRLRRAIRIIRELAARQKIVTAGCCQRRSAEQHREFDLVHAVMDSDYLVSETETTNERVCGLLKKSMPCVRNSAPPTLVSGSRPLYFVHVCRLRPATRMSAVLTPRRDRTQA